MFMIIINRDVISSLNFESMMKFKADNCLRLPNHTERREYNLDKYQSRGIVYICETNDEKKFLSLMLKNSGEIL